MLVIRGDKEEEQKRADVGDEEVKRSKHFDEEAGSIGKCSKTGETSSSSRKIDFASTGTAERAENSRVLGKDYTKEVIWLLIFSGVVKKIKFWILIDDVTDVTWVSEYYDSNTVRITNEDVICA